MNHHVLELAAQQIADATSKPPFLYELGPEGARKVLDDIQAAPIDKLDVDEKWITVPAEVGDVRVRIVKPRRRARPSLPAVLYVHGGGWVLGNAGTHDRLVRELAVGAEAAVVFVEYDRSPEAQYPVAIEQAYATAQWIVATAPPKGLDATRLAVAGDSVGGNMAAALAHPGQAARRRHLRAPVAVLPGHRRRPGHRQLPRVRRRAVPHGARRWPGSGTPTCRTGTGAARSPHHRCERRLDDLAGLPDGVRHRRRERRPARRGRGLRPQADRRPACAPRASATTARSTTS